MWPCENPQKRCIVIQNGRQNEVALITYVTVPIVTSYKENKTCRGGKKGGMAKINSGESAMKQKIGDQLQLTTVLWRLQ